MEIDEKRVRELHEEYKDRGIPGIELCMGLAEAGVPSSVVDLVQDMHEWIVEAKAKGKRG